jgi:hypothetical protein
MEKKIEQGRFYRIQYVDTRTPGIIELAKPVKVGKIYCLQNPYRRFLVLSEAKFKYTYEDIDNVRVMMEDYEPGTIQYNLWKRMVKAFNAPTPAVRFTDEEKEVLGYTYYENQFISESDRKTLRKILGIKNKDEKRNQ